MGLFTQLGMGFGYLLNPDFQPNWLLAKDAFWFFGHPIVYFTLFSFLAAAYYYIPKFTKKTVPYDKWAYRSWPFYFIFAVLVFSHHSYMDMPNPVFVQTVATIASQAVIFPSGLTVMTIMMYLLRSQDPLERFIFFHSYRDRWMGLWWFYRRPNGLVGN